MRFGLRELIFVALLLAVPVAAYFFVFEPRNVQIEQARQEIRVKQTKLQRLEAATANIEDLGAEIEKLTQTIELFEHKLPARKEVEVILKQIWELAAAQNLTPKSVRTDKMVQRAQYSELPIKMVIVGDFDGFYRFLLELEKLSRITRLPQMKISKLQNQPGHLQADLVLSIFFESLESPSVAQASGKAMR